MAVLLAPPEDMGEHAIHQNALRQFALRPRMRVLDEARAAQHHDSPTGRRRLRPSAKPTLLPIA